MGGGEKGLAKLVVDRDKIAPQIHETCLESGCGIGGRGDVAEETFDGFSLLVVKEGEVSKFLQVSDVDKEFVWVNHIVVYVLKVALHHLHEGIELVERLVCLDVLYICLVEGDDEVYRVSKGMLRERSKYFAYGGVFWCPDGLALGVFPKILVEKERGAFVGEDDGGVLEITFELGIEIISYEFEKRGIHDAGMYEGSDDYGEVVGWIAGM